MILIAISAVALLLQTPSTEEAVKGEFTEANQQLAYALGECARYQSAGLRDRLAALSDTLDDPFRRRAIEVSIAHYDEGRERESVRATTLSKNECDERVGRAIAAVAIAEQRLISLSASEPAR